MRQSTRLILNTASTYVRMALTVGLGLLATRWTMQTLGPVDWGIWAALINTVSVLLILSDGLGESVERFLAFEIGRGDPRRQREFFGTALTVMLAVCTLAILVGLPLGHLVISATIGSDQSVPAARSAGAAVWWAYTMTLGGLCLQIGSAPFRSVFRANQSLALLTVIDTLDSLLKLLAVVIAMNAPAGSDPLIYLCAALLAGQSGTALALGALCLRTYPNSRAGPRQFSSQALRELGGFTGWSIFGTVSYRIRMSGTPLLLQSGFGSLITGAYQIAVQVAGYQMNISSAMGKAVQPAITQATGRGDLAAVRRLIPSLNKLATLLAMFYLVPLIIETETVLDLWLKGKANVTIVPETATFVRLMLLIMGLPWLYSGYHAAIMGDGRIKKYMLSAVFMELVGLGIATLVVKKLGGRAELVPAIGLTTAAIAMCYWVWHISGLLEIPVIDWLTKTWKPVLSVGVPAVAGAWVVHLLIPDNVIPSLPSGLVRVVAVGATYGLVSLPLIWFFGLSEVERPHFRRVFGAAAGKLGLGGKGAEGPADLATPKP